MARVSQFITAPFQGLSQAPRLVRRPDQAEDLYNVHCPIPSGASKRPPFEWMGKLEDLNTDILSTFYFEKNGRDYLVTIWRTPDDLATLPKLYDITDLPNTGTILDIPISLSGPAAAYLYQSTDDINRDFAFLAIEDYVFILNRKVVVENSTDTVPSRPYEAMLWVKQAAYSRTYQVVVTYGMSTLTVTLKTPNGKDAEDAEDVDTDVIAKALYDGVYPVSTTGTTNGATITAAELDDLVAAGFTVTLVGSVIYISHPSVDFTLTVKDGQGGAALLAIKEEVQSFSQLPAKCPVAGFTVKVAQQSESDQDDYYLAWVETAGPGTGVWTETLRPGAELGVDPETLPVALLYDPDTDAWNLDVVGWGQRTVGDQDLIPDPGFIGQTLRDIQWWKGRIVLQYEEGARIGSASDPLAIYPTTLSQVLADDPFEIVNPLNRQARFRHFLPFKTLGIMWGEGGQAHVSTQGDILTPETAIAEPYAYYAYAPELPPQPGNDRVYFVAPRGKKRSAVYEMEVSYRTSGTDQGEADEMTVAVPKLLPAGIDKAATSPVNYTTVYGVTGDSELYVHLYRYSERQRVQNAWEPWGLPRDCALAGMFFRNTDLFVLVKRGSSIYLLKADTADGATTGDFPFQVKLDWLIASPKVTVSYNSTTDKTTFTCPFPFAEGMVPTIVMGPAGGKGGVEVDGDWLERPGGYQIPVSALDSDGGELVADGRWNFAPFYIGEDYLGKWTPTPPFYRDAEGSPIRSANLQVRNLQVEYVDTAVGSVRVIAGARPSITYEYTANQASVPFSSLEGINQRTEPFQVPVQVRAKDLLLDFFFESWLPQTIAGYTWTGEVNARSTQLQGGSNG